MASVRKHALMLQVLNKAKPALVKKIVQTADRGLIHTLCECALNLIKGNVPITPVQKRKLRRHKTGLRELVDKKVSLKKKKSILQRGGFVGALLTAVLPLVVQGIATAIRHKKAKKS